MPGMLTSQSAHQEASHEEWQRQLYLKLRQSFNSSYCFDEVIESKVLQFVSDCYCTSSQLHPPYASNERLAERYFDRKLFTSTEQRLVWAQIQIIFKACYILILSYQDYPRSLMLPDISSLLQCYPEFKDEGTQELEWLLRFRNMLRIALLVIPAENHKSCLIRVAASLEGSQKEYITGGGRKPAVQRREIIFERESGITPVKRPEGRKRPVRSENGSKVKTSLSSFSVKKLRLVQLGSGDLKALVKAAAVTSELGSSSSLTWTTRSNDNTASSVHPSEVPTQSTTAAALKRYHSVMDDFDGCSVMTGFTDSIVQERYSQQPLAIDALSFECFKELSQMSDASIGE